MKIRFILAAAALVMTFDPGGARADRSDETWICLKNTTSARKLIQVDNIYNNDWDGVSRPDRNWHNTYVEPGQTRCERAEINHWNNPTFTFVIPGGSELYTAKIFFRQQDREDNGEWRVEVTQPISANWNILLGAAGRASSASSQIGASCNAGPFCRLFTIEDLP